MKLKLLRQTGTPVDENAQQAYAEDWKKFYDKAAERAMLDVLKLQRFLSFGERALIRKHGSEVLVELPKSAKAWDALISKYGSTPIALAQRADGKGLVMILLDNLS